MARVVQRESNRAPLTRQQHGGKRQANQRGGQCRDPRFDSKREHDCEWTGKDHEA